jgi:hypothetical protein
LTSSSKSDTDISIIRAFVATESVSACQVGADFEEDVKIDFDALKELTHIAIDSQISFLNYDGRRMKCFGAMTDYWDETCSTIAKKTDLVRVSRHVGITPEFMNFSTAWCKKELEKPDTMEVNILSMTFYRLTRESCTIMPIFDVQGAESSTHLPKYQSALRNLLALLPGIPLIFHPGCTSEQKQQRLAIINPIRADYGLPPLEVNE